MIFSKVMILFEIDFTWVISSYILMPTALRPSLWILNIYILVFSYKTQWARTTQKVAEIGQNGQNLLFFQNNLNLSFLGQNGPLTINFGRYKLIFWHFRAPVSPKLVIFWAKMPKIRGPTKTDKKNNTIFSIFQHKKSLLREMLGSILIKIG